ncbi:MAG: hypothetical protein V8S72_04845 [Oscillospiraceae bacterium]
MAFEKISIPSPKEYFFDEIKSKILLGELRSGEKLPSERLLAEDGREPVGTASCDKGA